MINLIQRVKEFFTPKEQVFVSRDDVVESLFKKHGWHYNTTERCPNCNKLYFKGFLPANAEPCCECPNQNVRR